MLQVNYMEETPENSSPTKTYQNHPHSQKMAICISIQSGLVDEFSAVSPSSLSSEQPRFDAFVLDGWAFIYMMKPKNQSMIDEYWEAFLSHIQTYFYKTFLSQIQTYFYICNRVEGIFDI